MTSYSGLFSLFSIVFTVAMAIWLARYFKRKTAEDEIKAGRAARR